MPTYTYEQLLELSKSELVTRTIPDILYEPEIAIYDYPVAHAQNTGPAPIELLPVDAEASDDETHLNELANRYLLQRGSVAKGTKKDAASINSKLVVSQVQHESRAPVVAGSSAQFESAAPAAAPAAAEEEDGWISVEAKKPHHHKKRGGRRSFGSHYGQERLLNKSWRSPAAADEDASASAAVEE